MELSINLKCGKTRRKVEELSLRLTSIKEVSEGNWTYTVVFSGVPILNTNRTCEANSQFDAFVLGLAYMRQALRSLKESDPKLKLYSEFDGELEETTIEDIFWTHDCITNEMEDMIDFAIENGYEAN